MSDIGSQLSEKGINLKQVTAQIFRRWYIMISVVLICVFTAFLYTKFMCTPKYDSTAKMYIFNSGTNQISTSDIAVSTYLTHDYTELIVDRTVLTTVIDQLGLKYTYGGLKGAVTVSNPESTRIIEVTVRTSNAALSQKIADSICEVAQKKIVELMGIDRVNIISKAYLPTGASTPNMRSNLTYGLISGLLISCIIAIAYCIKDDKIANGTDVEQYLQISLLGTIPYGRSRSGKAAVTSRTVRN